MAKSASFKVSIAKFLMSLGTLAVIPCTVLGFSKETSVRLS